MSIYLSLGMLFELYFNEEIRRIFNVQCLNLNISSRAWFFFIGGCNLVSLFSMIV